MRHAVPLQKENLLKIQFFNMIHKKQVCYNTFKIVFTMVLQNVKYL
jgi:hypothetical protein